MIRLNASVFSDRDVLYPVKQEREHPAKTAQRYEKEPLFNAKVYVLLPAPASDEAAEMLHKLIAALPLQEGDMEQLILSENFSMEDFKQGLSEPVKGSVVIGFGTATAWPANSAFHRPDFAHGRSWMLASPLGDYVAGHASKKELWESLKNLFGIA